MTFRHLALVALLFTGPALRSQDPAPTTDPAPTATPAPAATLLGRIENDRYIAPGEVFSVALPALDPATASVFDNGEIVVFKDRTSTLLTIAAFPMPPIAKFDYDTEGPRDYLIAFFRDNIVRDYREAFPDSAIESARFLPGVFGGTTVAFTLLPGGSAFTPPTAAAGSLPRPVAKRGHLIFVQGDRIYVVAIELAERVTQPDTYKLTTEEEDRALFGRLVTVLSSLRIPAGALPPATPRP